MEFAAYAVGAGDEDWIGKAFGIKLEETGEATDFGENIFVEGAAGEAFDLVVGLQGAGLGTGRGRRRLRGVFRGVAGSGRPGSFDGRGQGGSPLCAAWTELWGQV